MKYVMRVVVTTDAKFTKKHMKEIIEARLKLCDSSFKKVRVQKVDAD